MLFARTNILVRKYDFPEVCDTLRSESAIIHLRIAILLPKLTNNYTQKTIGVSNHFCECTRILYSTTLDGNNLVSRKRVKGVRQNIE